MGIKSKQARNAAYKARYATISNDGITLSRQDIADLALAYGMREQEARGLIPTAATACPLWCGDVKRDKDGAIIFVSVPAQEEGVEPIKVADFGLNEKLWQQVVKVWRTDVLNGEIAIVGNGEGRRFSFPYAKLITSVYAWIATINNGDRLAAEQSAENFDLRQGSHFIALAAVSLNDLRYTRFWSACVAYHTADRAVDAAQTRYNVAPDARTQKRLDAAQEALASAKADMDRCWLAIYPLVDSAAEQAAYDAAQQARAAQETNAINTELANFQPILAAHVGEYTSDANDIEQDINPLPSKPIADIVPAQEAPSTAQESTPEQEAPVAPIAPVKPSGKGKKSNPATIAAD